jgi:hypothetical protein
MTLEEFVTEEKKRLDSFVTDWMKAYKKNPTDYPLEMYPGDWDEQFQLFVREE